MRLFSNQDSPPLLESPRMRAFTAWMLAIVFAGGALVAAAEDPPPPPVAGPPVAPAQRPGVHRQPAQNGAIQAEQHAVRELMPIMGVELL